MRQAISISSALLLVTTTAAVASAQEASPVSSAAPSPAVTAASSEPAATTPQPSPAATELDGPLIVGPWHVAALDEAPKGSFVRSVAAGASGLLALASAP